MIVYNINFYGILIYIGVWNSHRSFTVVKLFQEIKKKNHRDLTPFKDMVLKTSPLNSITDFFL